MYVALVICLSDMSLGSSGVASATYEHKETNCLLPLVGWEGQVIFTAYKRRSSETAK